MIGAAQSSTCGDGLAPEGPLFMDGEAFNLSDIGAEVDGLVGGFPCQAPFAFVGKGVSQQSWQAGWYERLSLMPSPRLWDQGGQKLLLGLNVGCMSWLRKFMILENVSHILSPSLRPLMEYLVKAGLLHL